jgi:hypothetical protein
MAEKMRIIFALTFVLICPIGDYGAQTVSGLSRVQLAVCRLLKLLYPTPPQPDKILTFAERNRTIRERHGAGESLSQLARAFGISAQRVQQIIKKRRK